MSRDLSQPMRMRVFFPFRRSPNITFHYDYEIFFKSTPNVMKKSYFQALATALTDQPSKLESNVNLTRLYYIEKRVTVTPKQTHM